MTNTTEHSSLKNAPAFHSSRIIVSGIKRLAGAGFALLSSFYILENHIDWRIPETLGLAFLALVAANVLTLALVDQHCDNSGTLTIAALLGILALSILFLINETFDRFVYDFGYDWLKPFAGLYAVFCAGAVFKDGHPAVKAVLALNGVAVAVLWNLCNSAQMIWPF